MPPDENLWKGQQQPAHYVKVRVPATSANIGPGFDAIGVALDLWNEVEVCVAEKFKMEIEGEGADCLPRDRSNLVVCGIESVFDAVAHSTVAPQFAVKCLNRIPFARGLGSSSAAIVSGMLAGMVLANAELSNDRLFNLACEMEGHPDNVGPAIYGGLQIGVKSERGWFSTAVHFDSELRCVVFVPNSILETSASRDVLPKSVPRQDATFNTSRTALLVSTFQSHRHELLRVAMQDRLHQPYRQALNPHMQPMVEAAIEAGAYGACLSGAGPSVLAWTGGGGSKGDDMSSGVASQQQKTVASAMGAVAAKLNCGGRVVLTGPVESGASVVDVKPRLS